VSTSDGDNGISVVKFEDFLQVAHFHAARVVGNKNKMIAI
jgi:hypothetical protein